MTQTQQKLIDRVKASPHGVGVVVNGYRTNRRRGRWGCREHAALCGLRDAGLVVIVSVESYRDCKPRYTDHWTEAVYKLA